MRAREISLLPHTPLLKLSCHCLQVVPYTTAWCGRERMFQNGAKCVESESIVALICEYWTGASYFDKWPSLSSTTFELEPSIIPSSCQIALPNLQHCVRARCSPLAQPLHLRSVKLATTSSLERLRRHADCYGGSL